MWSYKEAVQYIDSFINYEKKEDFSYNKRSFNLKRMECLLDLLGNPHQNLRTIHIAGTKGKGSTAAIIASVLRANGLKVGLYTSPHLITPRERIRIGEKLISKEEFAYFLSKIRFKLESSFQKIPFTFFEIYTALAFLYFFCRRVDLAVLETGLGGRLDATNVVYPLVAVITPISFDHTKELGKDLSSIAREKGGIIKRGVTVVTSPQKSIVAKVLERIAKEKRAQLYKVGESIQFKKIESDFWTQRFSLQTTKRVYSNLSLSLAGTHQLINAATAIGAIDLLEDKGIFLSPKAMRKGLKRVRWPGRIQILSTKPFFILDCAHNGASAQALANYIKENFLQKKIILILSVLKNKDIKSIVKILCPLAKTIILSRIDSPRALEPEEIKKVVIKFCRRKKIFIKKEVKNAVIYSRELACSEDLICATGSIYLAGEIMRCYPKISFGEHINSCNSKKEEVCA